MVTKKQVQQAKETYLALRKQYNQEQTTTVHLKRAPDEYRGEMSCVFIYDVKYEHKAGANNVEYVVKNGVRIGELRSTYGNNGMGKLACQSFYRYPGVTAIWHEPDGSEYIDCDKPEK